MAWMGFGVGEGRDGVFFQHKKGQKRLLQERQMTRWAQQHG